MESLFDLRATPSLTLDRAEPVRKVDQTLVDAPRERLRLGLLLLDQRRLVVVVGGVEQVRS